MTTYADATVQPQTTYTYRVRSFRNGGGGAVSNDATVTTPATQPVTVAAPNLQASAGQGSVTLAFRIRRRGPNDADFIDIAEVAPNVAAARPARAQLDALVWDATQKGFGLIARKARAGGGS